MAFPLLPATLGLIAAGLAALNYFVPPEPDESAPETIPLEPPFELPFEGGQCVGNAYTIVMGAVFDSGTSQATRYYARNLGSGTDILADAIAFGNAQPPFIGAIPAPTYSEDSITIFVDFGSLGRINIPKSFFSFPVGFTLVPDSLFVAALINRNNPSDPCGNLPNPNPPYPIGGTGLADSPDPDLDENAEPLVEGLVPVNLAALLAAALAAMQAAETLAALARALADAIRAIKDLIDELKPENRDKNKSKFKFDFGEIQKDGYLKFYGTNNNPNFEAIYLDILFTAEPIGIGKYFGNFSPNRYIYDRLGYIAFVSPSLGVMEVRELEFYRCSLSVPKDCVGFFYHLGLSGSIKANASAIYELKLEPIEDEE